MARSDTRGESAHDCDRILYSDAFRRLGGVTQVVAVGEKPLFHNRLTHTLKVSQLSRRMAEQLLGDESAGAAIAALGGLDAGAAEAAGLAHDLGHPPFGHIGETKLNDKCEASALDGYEGNAQSFRILTKLAIRDRAHRGLKLSDRTLDAVLKYPWLREHERAGAKKWNAYLTEREDFDRVRANATGERQSLEAAIMDWADDITYAVHDVEDFFRAGRIPIARLLQDSVELAKFAGQASTRLVDKDSSFDAEKAVSAFERQLTISFGTARYYRGSVDDRAGLTAACRYLINRYASAVVLDPEGDIPVRIPTTIRYEVELLKQLTWHYVIHDPALATLQEGQSRLLDELFDRLMNWLDNAIGKREQYRLPTALWDLYSESEGEDFPSDTARQARAVADYLASLTEAQATDLHERLHGVASHSVLDPWMAY